MIICFSGTGNSRMVAEAIQKATDEELVIFAPGLFHHPEYIKIDITDDRVVLVAPVYAWTIPKFCANAIDKAKLYSDHTVTHHLILTCGDDIGYADVMWHRLMSKRGWLTGSVYSVQMPNTFVGMKGFDVDSEEVANAKLQAMHGRVAHIIESLDNYTEPVTDVVRGSWPRIKTFVLSPLFYKWMSPSRFRTNEDCNACGRCARNCPVANITMAHGKPAFGKNCAMCFRCYHICPRHALNYGNTTNDKGQYLCPGQNFTP